MVAHKLVALAAVLSTVHAQGGGAPDWGQCGGSLWQGPTSCAVSTQTCSSLNEWFYQCLRPVRSTQPPSPISTRSSVPATTTLTMKTTTRAATTKSTKSVKLTTTKKGPITTTQQITTAPPVSTTVKPTTTTPIKPKETFNYLITFGDSYSQTGFNIDSTKPSIGNQLGNPPLPGWTTSGGLNWIGNLLTSDSKLLSYNLAYGGATTDANLVTPFQPTVLSFVDQVNEFSANLASKPSYAPWTAADTLFGVWIGVNDVGNAWGRADWATLSVKIVDQYFAQVQRLYDAGARKFVFLTVPPINRAPTNLDSGAANQATLAAAIQTYNKLIVAHTAAFNAANAGAQAQVVDVFPTFNTILDNPIKYGATDNSCFNADGKTCLWWNNYHPGLAIQKAVADDVANQLGLN